MRSEVSHPTHLCPQSLRKRDRREKPRSLLQVMSSAQEHLSVICAKFLQLQVAQIRV